MTVNLMKQKVGYRAAEWVEDGMLVGIGTGSTVHFFIERLIARCKEGLNIQAVCSSFQSEKQAKEGGIPLIEPTEVTAIDLTIDGADEIDSQKRMIKGGGGALLREKILANSSREMVVIVDEGKVVKKLGARKLPLEILPFCHLSIITKIKTLGFRGELRSYAPNTLFSTDNGNLIYDIEFNDPRDTPEEDHDRLIRIPGIIETGYFFNLAGRVLIGKENGDVEIWS